MAENLYKLQQSKNISCSRIFSVLKFCHLELFLKDHTIKSFEMENFCFNRKSVFDCKDGTLCPWQGGTWSVGLTYSRGWDSSKFISGRKIWRNKCLYVHRGVEQIDIYFYHNELHISDSIRLLVSLLWCCENGVNSVMAVISYWQMRPHNEMQNSSLASLNNKIVLQETVFCFF